ncbi:MAG: hypothetical protein PHI59_09440 [Candidatus Omnitrophica bacterium]|nr:hypothetical protein [Candidatus Omnitrophota bacterium]
MEKKGLCDNCVNGTVCVFPQKFPVWQCEEFNNSVIVIEEKQGKAIKPKRGSR